MPRPIIRGSGPRDGFPDFIVRRLRRDKLGVLVGVVDRQFEVGAVNQRIEPQWLDQGLAPDPGWNLPCIDCDAEIRDGHVVVHYLYEGQESDYSFAESAVTYEFNPTTEDEAIEAHPFIDALISKHGYDIESRQFAEFLGGDATKAGFASGSDRRKRNPLFGTEAWRNYAGEYRYSYSRRTVPASAWARVNQTVTRPPGIEKIGGNFSNRIWLKQAPNVVVRGNVSQITENYLLSKPGGSEAARIIYDGKGLSGGSSSSGLTTGGLTTGSL